MSEWLENSLALSICELKEIGLGSAASDLQRLLSSGRVANMRLYRDDAVADVAEHLEQVLDIVDLKDFLHTLAPTLGVDHVTLHCCSAAANALFTRRVVTTYPANWVDTYVTQEFSKIDPILLRAEESATGFYWDSLDFAFPVSARFREIAAKAGIGPSGYTLPVEYERGIRLACTVTSRIGAEEFREQFSCREHDLRLLMEDLGECFMEVGSVIRQEGARLSLQAHRFLWGLSRGKTPEEMASSASLDIQDLTREVCEIYGTRTLWQALAYSIQAGHLSDSPFDLAEIQC